jgi:hypothetical protein
MATGAVEGSGTAVLAVGVCICAAVAVTRLFFRGDDRLKTRARATAVPRVPATISHVLLENRPARSAEWMDEIDGVMVLSLPSEGLGVGRSPTGSIDTLGEAGTAATSAGGVAFCAGASNLGLAGSNEGIGLATLMLGTGPIALAGADGRKSGGALGWPVLRV